MTIRDADEICISLSDAQSDVSQPDPPLTIVEKGHIYHLYSCYSVRQSSEEIPTSLDASNTLVSESLLDLDSQQRSSICEVSNLFPLLQRSFLNSLFR